VNTKLSYLAASAAGLFIIAAGIGLSTSGKAYAQGAGGRPATDVKVINTTAETVPVAVQGTPTVNVGSLPAVQVSSLPAVQVGNNTANPVPVTVTNNPVATDQGTPVVITGEVNIPPGNVFSSTPAYHVPSGKLLIIESFDWTVRRESTAVLSSGSLDTDLNGQHMFTEFGAEATMPSHQSAHHMLKQYATGFVSVWWERSTVQPTLETEPYMRFTLQGRLYDAP
jgi:hypothetical protein